LKVAHDLRDQGINVDMALEGGSKVKKIVGFADKAGIPYVGFIGEQELADGTISIKDLKAHDQVTIPLATVKGHILL